MGVVKTLKRRLSSSSSKASTCETRCLCGLTAKLQLNEDGPVHRLERKLHALCSFNKSAVDWSIDISKLSTRLQEAIDANDRVGLRYAASDLNGLKQDMRKINQKTQRKNRRKKRNQKKFWKSLSDQEYRNEISEEKKMIASWL
mmetsp:Transcript_13123/g.15022  ORF Transcript_13123/g.15022 Transcript_13123/m.15022 type:complete len:144 (-) Transcript_13123:200-631(-)